jgi:hypothetical protein
VSKWRFLVYGFQKAKIERQVSSCIVSTSTSISTQMFHLSTCITIVILIGISKQDLSGFQTKKSPPKKIKILRLETHLTT